MISELPVIDVAPLRSNSSEAAKAKVAEAIRHACIETGFFYITGHGIPQEQLDGLLKATSAFFDLSPETKSSLAASLSPLHRGWTGVGGAHNCTSDGQSGPDQKESFLLGAEGGASPMHGPNPWPSDSLLPGWQATVSAYFASALALSRDVSRGLALALGLPEAFFLDHMRDPVAQLLLLRYPPPAAPLGGGGGGAPGGEAVGCGEHTDCGFLTILAQDDVPGLEVRPRSAGDKGDRGPAGSGGGDGGVGGGWVAAPPVPGALLVNLGDLTEFWSGGLFRSTPHRVSVPRGARSGPRHSVPFFCNVNFDAEVAPMGGDGQEGVQAAAGGREGSAGGATTAGRYILQKLGLMYE